MTGHQPPRRVTDPRTILTDERGEIADWLRVHRPDMDEDRITELLDFAELHGTAISFLDGVEVFLARDDWGGDLFSPVRPEESADGVVA